MPGFTLKGKIQLDGSNWKAGLDQADRQADQWGQNVSKTVQGYLLSAFSLTAVLSAARASISQFEQQLEGSRNLVREARRSGAGRLFKGAGEEEQLARSIEFIQEFGLALDQVGIEADRATDILQDIAVRRIEALDGIAEGKFNDQVKAFASLGISPASLKDTTGPELLMKLGENLKGKQASDKLIGGMDALFGDAGVDMLVLLREGLQDTMQRMRQEGLIVGGEEVLNREAVRREQAILDRKAELEVNRSNKALGRSLAERERQAKLGLFSAIGTPSETIIGTGANLAELFGANLQNVQTDSNLQLEALLEIRQAMREVRDNTARTSENTRPLKD